HQLSGRPVLPRPSHSPVAARRPCKSAVSRSAAILLKPPVARCCRPPGSNPGVASGSTCTFTLTFTPTATGTRTGLLTVNGTNGATLVLSLSGTGGHGALGSISPASLSFPAQAVGTSIAPHVLT